MMLLRRVIEGESCLFVPVSDLPEHAEVFYHPEQALSRDFSILVYRAIAGEVLDSMSGTGARAVRLAKNGIKVVANDISERAVHVIELNMLVNGVKFEICNQKAEVLFHSRKFEAVDLDPFGTPAPFIHCALHSAKRWLGVTATDTAALAGTYPRVGRRRYGIKIKRLPNYQEIGLRALAGFVVREAAKLEMGAQPIFSHAYRHYYRVYFSLRKGAGRADRALEHLGWYDDIGPLWMGNLWDKKIVKRMKKIAGEVRLAHKKTGEHLQLIEKEVTYGDRICYELHGLCSELKISPPPMAKVLEKVQGVRTHLSPTGFRSPLTEEEVKEKIKRLSS